MLEDEMTRNETEDFRLAVLKETRVLKKSIVYDNDHRGPEKASKDTGLGGPDLGTKKQANKDMMRTRGPEGHIGQGSEINESKKNRGPEDGARCRRDYRGKGK
jgi:hypothetical protein